MKVCIKGSEFNPSLIHNLGEQYAIDNKYSIYEVPEGCEDCAFEDFDEKGFNIELYNARKEREVNFLNFTQERQELLDWFEEYDKQVMQYNRCQRLGVEFDKDISELDAQADINQQRLREINEFFKPKVVEVEDEEENEEPSEVVEVQDE